MRKFYFAFVFAMIFALTGFAGAMIGPTFYTGSSGGTFVNYQATNPGFESYYGGDKSTYWPILAEGDRGCTSGQQDMMLQVAPGGCQPMVVRSDLLAEQNVPVFCQISAYQINPLINIEKIKSISFSGSYPKEVAGTGFHPAKAALRTKDILLGSPITDNVGYVVVILKKTEKERDLPKFVNVTLRAKISYEAGNMLGIGRTEFILEPVSDLEWNEKTKAEESFWRGRYSARLDGLDTTSATISLYYGDKRFSTVRLKNGETSGVVYAPGFYCSAGLKVQFIGSEIPKNKARLEISEGGGTQIVEAYENGKIINDKCVIRRIATDSLGTTGSVEIQCPRERIILSIGSKTLSGLDVFVNSAGIYTAPKSDGSFYSFDFGKEGEYQYDWLEGSLFKKDLKGQFESVNIEAKSGSERVFLDKIKTAFARYHQIKTGGQAETAGGDKVYDNNGIDNNLTDALKAYESFAGDYSAEKDLDEKYGETALTKAIKLAQDSGRQSMLVNLMNQFIKLYPDSEQSAVYQNDLKRIGNTDISKASRTSVIDNEVRTIRLVGFGVPKERANARFIIEGREDVKLEEGRSKILGSFDVISAGKKIKVDGFFNVTGITVNEARIVTNCDGSTAREGARITQTLRVDIEGRNTVTLCGQNVKLDEIETKQVARVALIPDIRVGQDTNLSVTIGIEKRAIQLSPEKTKDKISRLNDTIKKWEGISENLGKVVTGMKGACFATSGILMFKNFMSGLSGETIARQQVMQGEKGWTRWCQSEMGKDSSKYASLDDCFRKNADKIDSDVVKVSGEINTLNKQIETIDSQYESGGFLESKSVDSSKARQIYVQRIQGEFKGNPIADNVSAEMTSSELRDTWLNLRLKRDGGLSESASANVDSKLAITEGAIKRVAEYNKMKGESDRLVNEGLAPAVDVGVKGRTDITAPVVDRATAGKKLDGFKGDKSATIRVPSVSEDWKTGSGEFSAGNYVLDLKSEGSNVNSVQGVYENIDGNYKRMDDARAKLFTKSYGIGNVKAVDSKTYYHRILNPEIRYYDTEPYKGMPAVVPFDVEHGWYAATKQTLPTFGGIGAYDASGRVASFMICNVDGDSRINFDEGYGDDVCEEININTGQAYDMFPGLSREQAKDIVSRAKSALEEAARNYGKGKSTVTIAGQSIRVGKSMTNVPGTNCQDFASPKDCLLMFNVCDPVVCPASRCNLGGKYQVADVVQSGVIGSIFLCLPNIKEGIAIPVCVSGIKAGIDGYLSVMKSYKDCLQENLNTGKMVGVCDQIYSIYTCELFWREVSPIANIIIPKLLETAYGQGARGGGEYLSVMSAWDNMRNSIDYFTQSYAVNSMKAFRARNIEEAGGEFCKAYISMASPKTIKSLLEPDSPPQFYATLSSTRYSDATIPTTAQYKVYYHIFAGGDTGVYYTVYLKGAPESSYSHISASVQVASGFITRGQYASQTRDFTAPEGYKELCVRINEKEECGFKQVTSEFAVNYLKDNFAKSELERKDITSETECISGSPGLNAGVLTPNIQQAGEEIMMPQIYNRGVVRVCATDNPGKTTNPGRFVDVGYCGNTKLRCWLDGKSVDNAITDANRGMMNETLQYLQNLTMENLKKSGEIMSDEEANLKMGEMRALRNRVSLAGGTGGNIGAIVQLSNDIEKLAKEVDGRIYKNNQKALVEITRAEAKDKLIRAVIDEFKGRIPCGNGKRDSGEECDYSIFPDGCLEGKRCTDDCRCLAVEVSAAANVQNIASLSLSNNYNLMDDNKNFVKINGKESTKVYVLGTELRIQISDSEDYKVADIFPFRDKSGDYISMVGGIGKDKTVALYGQEFWNLLGGATINEGSASISPASGQADSGKITFIYLGNADSNNYREIKINFVGTGLYVNQSNQILLGKDQYAYVAGSIQRVSDITFKISLVPEVKQSVNALIATNPNLYDELNNAEANWVQAAQIPSTTQAAAGTGRVSPTIYVKYNNGFSNNVNYRYNPSNNNWEYEKIFAWHPTIEMSGFIDQQQAIANDLMGKNYEEGIGVFNQLRDYKNNYGGDLQIIKGLPYAKQFSIATGYVANGVEYYIYYNDEKTKAYLQNGAVYLNEWRSDTKIADLNPMGSAVNTKDLGKYRIRLIFSEKSRIENTLGYIYPSLDGAVIDGTDIINPLTNNNLVSTAAGVQGESGSEGTAGESGAGLSLSEPFNVAGTEYVILNAEQTDVYLKNNKVYRDDLLFDDTLGTINSEGKIALLASAEGVIGSELYSKLNGADVNPGSREIA